MKKAFIQLHIAVFLAGFTGILGKLISLNEGWLVWYRLLITTVTLWFIAILRDQNYRIAQGPLMRIFGIGCIATLHWLCFYGSIKYGNASIAMVCYSAVGFFTSLLEPAILRTRVDWTECLLGSLTIIGIYFIFQFDPGYKTGILLGLMAALLGSIFPILNKGMLMTVSFEMLILYELSGGFIFLSMQMPVYLKIFPGGPFLPSLRDWGWLFVLSWVCTVFAFNLSMRALQRISAFTVNLSYNLEPVYGVLLAFLFLKENRNLHSGFYAGLGCILFSIIAQMLRLWRKRERPLLKA